MSISFHERRHVQKLHVLVMRDGLIYIVVEILICKRGRVNSSTTTWVDRDGNTPQYLSVIVLVMLKA
jgi:hypothetical protein